MDQFVLAELNPTAVEAPSACGTRANCRLDQSSACFSQSSVENKQAFAL